jgi:hypothetical protein
MLKDKVNYFGGERQGNAWQPIGRILRACCLNRKTSKTSRLIGAGVGKNRPLLMVWTLLRPGTGALRGLGNTRLTLPPIGSAPERGVYAASRSEGPQTVWIARAGRTSKRPEGRAPIWAARTIAWLALAPATLLAATNEIPPLRPPRGEITVPTGNERGWLVVVAIVVLLAIVALCLKWLVRSRPGRKVPPEIAACQALERLRERPEDAALAVEVSGIVRTYLRSALKLPPEELTTAELEEALREYAALDGDLVVATIEFLRYCDQVKFAPARPSPTVVESREGATSSSASDATSRGGEGEEGATPNRASGAVVGGLRLVGKFETRRRQAIVEGQPGWGGAGPVGSGT